MVDNPAAVLQVRGLTVRYGSVRAVHGLNLDVSAGEVLGVIGANGAGKSSLVNAIAGATRSSSGSIALNSRDITKAPVTERVRAGIAVSPEGRGILAGMTVEENLRLGAYSVRRRDRNVLGGRLAEAFAIFPVLGERRSQMAQTLSGGEAAMLSVARALMSGPCLLLLDEPSLGLAPIMRQRLFERIAVLKRTGLAMVIVEQRAAELLEVSDRLLQMRRGESAGIGRAAEMDAESLARLYFGAAAAPGPSAPS
ncbi:ABC transporter ATP-binding protein [Dactylosporangium sp. NPDC005572]|uniref:ABC transporter ATP-binding protein n=1 Tax=Dactylosporangium sp. NPDC005572 TaxID=3156889 RepID=UPI0033AEFA3C